METVEQRINRFSTTSYSPFKPNSFITEEQLKEVGSFSLAMVYGVGHTNIKNFGEIGSKRDKQSILFHQFEGKLAECAVVNLLKQRQGIKITEPDFGVRGRGNSDLYDAIITNKVKEWLTSIKSTTEKGSFLLLETSAYDDNMLYIKERDRAIKHDLFFLTRVKIDNYIKANLYDKIIQKEIQLSNIAVEVVGYIAREDILKKINTENRVLRKGSSGFGQPLLTDNYVIHASELKRIG